MTSDVQRSVRDEMLHAAVGLLDEHGPDALQTRKLAGAAGTSTMAVYTHFGGMRGLIAEVAKEGLRQFDAAQTVPLTADPVADLFAIGAAYRRYAIERPHMYRLMFGSTSAHGINAPAGNVLTLTVAEIERHHPSFAHVVRVVRRCILAGRIT
ncbi:TetR/AcrR family transcriptional regulator, partial [Mycobacterium sp.]|uniref:TetR/AcrR family transcriptional regulator n=1 Tax=Mycobacterium sp. TaxID=1785 RepID=UPI003F7CE444